MRVEIGTEPVNQAIVVALISPLLPHRLSIRSDWTDARPVDRRWVFEELEPGRVVEVQVAGRRLTATADEHGCAATEWDGLDAGGNAAGPTVATVNLDGDLQRLRLGRWDARTVGLGGLLVAGYDHLDPVGRRVHLGTGRARRNIAVTEVDDGWQVPLAGGRRLARFDADGFLARVTEQADDEPLLLTERDADGLRVMDHGRQRLRVDRSHGSVTVSSGRGRLDVDLDGDGLATVVRGPGGGVVRLLWEAGLLAGITDAAGRSSSFEHDDDGRLVRFSRPGRGTTRLVRTATEHGRRVVVLTAEGRESSYQLDVLPDGTRVRTTRCCGRPPRVVRTRGPVREVEVGDGTQVRIDRGTGTRRTTLPSGLVHERTVTRSGIAVDGATWSWTRRPDMVLSTSPEGRTKGVSVDGDEVTMQRSGARVTMHRGDDGLLTRISQYGRSWDVERDDAGRVVRVTADDGTETRMSYDDAGWLVRQDLPGDRTVLVERAPDGRVVGLTPPGGSPTRMLLDGPGLLAAVSFPTDELTIERDADGLVTGYRIGAEPAIGLRRDANGLLIETNVEGRVLTRHEYEHGRPTRATTAAGQVTAAQWDGRLLTAIEQTGPVRGAVHRSHGTDLQVDAVACGPLHANVVRDRDGLVTGLGPAQLDRDEHGRLVAVRAGVVEQTWQHDEHGRVTTMQVTVRGTVGWQVDYERDAAGRVVTLTDSRHPDGTPSTFDYDAAGRLVEATGPFPWSATWDANGNAVAWSIGGHDHTAVHGPDDRLQAIDGAPVDHDSAGRLRHDPVAAQRFTHDERGRLVAVATAAQPESTTLLRDAHGYVVRLSIDGERARHLLPGPYGHPEAVVDADGAPLQLLVGGTRDAPPVLAVENDRTLLLACDHLGTVRLVVDIDTGELVDERVHDHWGQLVRRSGDSLVPFGWGCGLLDPTTGLVHFPARSYSPTLLRFLTRDPLLFRGRSTNLYAFTGGDPVNHGDPTGTTRLCRQGWMRWAVPGTDVGETWEHWWLEDKDGNEAGWGPEGDSDYNSTSAPGEFGEVRDHGNRSESAECDEVEDVDDDCVAREMKARMGDELGFWAPGNTCQNWVDDVLSACATNDGEYTVETDNPDAYDNVYSPDVTTRPKDGGGGYSPADGEYTPVDGGSLWE